MKKDFITATPDSGGSGSTTVTATASANQTESTRSTSLSVAGGGMTQAVSLSQAAVVIPTYEISFTSDVAFGKAFLFNTANQPSAVPGNFKALSSEGMNIDPVEWVVRFR